MSQSIDLSRAAMVRQQAFIDASANNIANVNTAGFKIGRPELETGELSPPDGASSPGVSAEPALSGNLQFDRLFTQGPIHDTGQPADLAIDGDGFFVVQQADGSSGYTRDGQLAMNANGQLTDATGRLVQPPITIPSGSGAMHVSADGTVTASANGGPPTPIGKLQLAVFANPNGLLAGADGVFSATAASGAPALQSPGQAGAGLVRQGALEQSNADVTEQLSNLVSAQRAYELNTSAFNIGNQLLQMANQMQSSG